MTEKGYYKLFIWQKAHEFVIEIYKITKDFPSEEKYDLVSQIRRSAKSIATNIVEGQASGTRKMFLSYLYTANASLVETEYHLELSHDLGYLTNEDYNYLDLKRQEVGKMLNSLINSLKDKL
jgi:four helix bundle protein